MTLRERLESHARACRGEAGTLIAQEDLRSADLRSANLSLADLRSADLSIWRRWPLWNQWPQRVLR